MKVALSYIKFDLIDSGRGSLVQLMSLGSTERHNHHDEMKCESLSLREVDDER